VRARVRVYSDQPPAFVGGKQLPRREDADLGTVLDRYSCDIGAARLPCQAFHPRAETKCSSKKYFRELTPVLAGGALCDAESYPAVDAIWQSLCVYPLVRVGLYRQPKTATFFCVAARSGSVESRFRRRVSDCRAASCATRE